MFRIVTEDKNVEGIKAALLGFDLDFTLFRGIGSWRGKEEPSLAVELDRISREMAEDLAYRIKIMNEQEAVLLQEFPEPVINLLTFSQAADFTTLASRNPFQEMRCNSLILLHFPQS